MISLFKRGCFYYVRTWVPDDLKCYIEKREIWTSLRTTSHNQAKSLSKTVQYKIETIFTQIRSGMLTEAQIKLIIKEHLTNTLKGSESIRSKGVLTALPKGTETIPPLSEWRDTAKSTFQQVIDKTNNELFNNDFSAVKAYVNLALERNGIAYAEGSPEYMKLCREYLKAEIAISKIELERLDGNYDNDFDGFMNTVLGTDKMVSPVSEVAAPVTMLTEIIEGHIKECQQAESWTEKTYAEDTGIYNVFLDVIGDRDIATIVHKDLISFRDKLVKLPANRDKKPAYKGKSIEQILAMKNVPAMSISTVNKYLIRISSLFKWATKHGYLAANYAEGLTLPKSKRADQEREAYSEKDIQNLIANLTLVPKQPERYWIPLIALYEGMRLEEICQLHLVDIIELEGIPCFEISDGEGKKVKTLSSRRKVPIHPTLLSLGFLEYVEKLRKANKVRLWENLKNGRDGYSTAFGKWYQKFNRDYVTKNDKLVFHSFRHNLANSLKQKGVQEITIAEIIGHSTDSMTMSRYGKRYEPKVLLEALKLIDYHKLKPSVDDEQLGVTIECTDDSLSIV